MRILVTGSQGTLGIPLVHELRERGHTVFGMDLAHHDHEYELRGDVREARQVDACFEASTPELVYHLAAEFGRRNGQQYGEQLWTTNSLGTHNVIHTCVKHNAHLVFASSSEAYGDGADVPGLIHEDRMTTHVPKFHNEYALTKWTGEKQIEIARQHHGLHATVLRFFNVYGPGEHYSPYRSVVCLFVYRMLHRLPIIIYRGGWRDFLYVGDWTRTVANAADRTNMLDGAFINIGGDDFLSVEELAELVMLKTGYDLTPNYREAERANVQIKRPALERAYALLGHECRIGLNDGLDHTIEWMKEVYGHSIPK